MPPVPAAGVPLSTPVPCRVEGDAARQRRRLVLSVGVGKPVAVTVKRARGADGECGRCSALVIAGAWLTVSVKFCVASAPTPLVAVNVIG